MGTVRFGKQDTITCIVNVEARGTGGEPACLAFKTSIYWLGGGVYLSDGGYVLKPLNGNSSYYELSQEAAREGQVEGLPHPLPPYSIPFMEYVGGYSLWWCIGVVLLWAVGAKKVRQLKQSVFESQQMSAPVDRGPPRLETKGDRFIDEAFRPMLAPGERIQHQAYASSWDFNGEKEGDEVYFLALTTTRLLIMMTRKGAFGILFEKGAVDVTKRADVTSAHVDHGKVLFVTASHVQRGYLVKGTRALSNQQAFLMNAGRLLEGQS